MSMPMSGLIWGVLGTFTVFGSWWEWSFIVNNHRAAFIVKLFGYQGMRLFYILLGGFLIVGGLIISSKTDLLQVLN